MAAIDLLFQTKVESERLHQVALGPILTRSRLLDQLDIPGTPTPDAWEWEPERGLFDLAIPLSDPEWPDAEPTRRVWIELKIDSELDSSQLDRQLEFLDGKPDHLLYLLLGTTAYTGGDWRDEIVQRRREVDGACGIVCNATKLMVHLQDLAHEHDSQGSDGDLRDLILAYHRALDRLSQRVEGFRGRPLQEWQYTEYVGFFAELLRRNPAMKGQTWIGEVSTPRGGFAAAAWGWRPLEIDGSHEVYLQWEGYFRQAADLRLCIKIKVQDRANASGLRNAAHEMVMNAARQLGVELRRPNRFGTGEAMTVAILDARPLAGSEDWDTRWDLIGKAIGGAEAVLANLGP